VITNSIWQEPLAGFSDDVAAAKPAPAAVVVSCVCADLGLGLLLKVLKIVGRRKSFAGDLAMLNALIAAAEKESGELRATADDDIAAVGRFVGSHDPEAAWAAIEIPSRAARVIARGVDLCAQARGMVTGLPAADLGSAVLLLMAALRAILLSVDFNLASMSAPDARISSLRDERRSLEDHAAASAAQVKFSL
jgi:formiminotetrahydrofolate cyclodeaminase